MTAGLNRLLLSAGVEPRLNFPPGLLTSVKKIAEFPESLIANFVFFRTPRIRAYCQNL